MGGADRDIGLGDRQAAGRATEIGELSMCGRLDDGRHARGGTMSRQPTIEVAARPSPFSFESTKTAVVVVDMQNDFASSGGMFDLAGIDISCIQAIVPNVRAVVEAARAVAMPIVFLKMGFASDLTDAGFPSSPTWLKHAPLRVGDHVTSPDGRASRILVRDCWNTDVVDELPAEPTDIVMYKTRYSGFHGTDLDDVLKRSGIECLIVVGATTSVCVDSTVRDAMFRDYHCLVVSDATAEPIAADAPRSNHEASLLTLELLFAHVATATDLVLALRTCASVVA
jgi:ureidoacrylate peracid hydrolase